MLYDVLRNTAHQNVAKSGSTVCADYNHVDVFLFRKVNNHLGRFCDLRTARFTVEQPMLALDRRVLRHLS